MTATKDHGTALQMHADPDGLTELGAIGPWRVRFAEEQQVGARAPGPLEGMRVAVKDVFAVAGQQTGAGNPTVLRQARIEPVNSAAVAALIDAGALISGISRTDELAFSIAGVNDHEGIVTNPARPGFLVGGSSSGSAAAVAEGSADVGLGTDTAGSIRVPASYCGLWGLRLTHGVVSVEGLRPLAPSFDSVGLLTRDGESLAAAARALGALEGSRPYRRMVIPTALLNLLDEASRAPFLKAADLLARSNGLPGTEASDFGDPDHVEEWFASFRAIQAHEAWYVNHDLLMIDGAISPDVRSRLLAGQNVDLERHLAVLSKAKEAVLAQLYGDAVICVPSTSTSAPRLGVSRDEQEHIRARTLRLTFLASLAGLPALSVPELVIQDAPIGLSLVGAPNDDLKLVRFASRISREGSE